MRSQWLWLSHLRLLLLVVMVLSAATWQRFSMGKSMGMSTINGGFGGRILSITL